MSRIKSVSALVLALSLVAASMALAQGGTEKKAPAPATTHAKSTVKMAKCDLNSASKEELMKLNGIDDATAEKIIADRPFKAKGELVSKGIVTKEEFAKISAHLVARKAAK